MPSTAPMPTTAKAFAEALIDARDMMGAYLAATLWDLDPDFLDYGDVADALLAVDERETGGRYAEIIDRNFERRGIGILHAGPRFEPKRRGRLPSRRTVLPRDRLQASEDELSGAVFACENVIKLVVKKEKYNMANEETRPWSVKPYICSEE